MSYASLPSRYPGMYTLDEDSGLWVPIHAKAKKDPLCQVAFCTRPSEKSSGYGRSLKCPICRVRLWRANNPIKATYNAIKNKARRRKIPFDLSIEYFTRLCEETGFHLARGRQSYDLQLDRIDALRGYHDDNVRVITAAENRDKANFEETRSRAEWEEYAASGDGEVPDLPDPGEFDDPF